MYDVITVGSATLDVFADTESELIKIMTTHSEEDFLAYPSGSKIIIKELIFTTGGGGTNTAVSFSRMGLKTAYIGKVGNDENGKRILSELEKEKVKFIGIKGSEMSGYSIILDSIEDDRTILTYKGANDSLNFEDVKKSELKTKWIYSSSMMGDSFTTIEKLAVYSHKKGINFAFNPSSYLAKKGMSYLKKIISNTNVLVLNKEEANLILGLVDAGYEMLLNGLHIAGPQYVVITDGKGGVHAYDGKNAYFLPSHKINVVETTGAGDAYASSFVSALIKTDDFKLAMKVAMVNAESVLTHKGAKNKLLTWKEALSRIKKEKFEFHHLKI